MKIPGVSTVHVENKAVLKLLGLDESDHNCCTLDALIVKVQIDCFSGGSRICKRGAKVERPRRKYRGCGVGRGFSPHWWRSLGGGSVPSPDKFFDFRSKNVDF